MMHDRTLVDRLLGRVRASYATPLEVQDAIKRVASVATKEGALPVSVGVDAPLLHGYATWWEVRLWRPGQSAVFKELNDYSAVFVGRFVREHDRTVLHGVFRERMPAYLIRPIMWVAMPIMLINELVSASLLEGVVYCTLFLLVVALLLWSRPDGAAYVDAVIRHALDEAPPSLEVDPSHITV